MYPLRAQERHRCRGLDDKAINRKLAAVGNGGGLLRQAKVGGRGQQRAAEGGRGCGEGVVQQVGETVCVAARVGLDFRSIQHSARLNLSWQNLPLNCAGCRERLQVQDRDAHEHS